MEFKKLIGLFFIAIIYIPCFGQDILFMRNGGTDTVKVQEITPTEIVFKKFKRLNGPLYRINKADVVLIEFEDGTVEAVDAPPEKITPQEEAARKKEAFAKSLGRHIITINYMNLFVGNLYGGYERISADGVIGLKLTLNYHIKSIDTDILGYDRDFTTGLDLNFYPTKQGKVKYFLGPGLRVGKWSDNFTFFSGGFGGPGPQNQSYTAFSFYFNNGFIIQPTANFFMGFQGGFGIAFLKLINNVDRSYFSEPDGIFAFNMGYRF
jgi:hypothetical protein